ncbi:LOB domain-containing protein 21 [Abeliophyllum distichum]|uniref:LOB domain-containing protein 21 n=1 Tax=Abeliophyllum distichum TaxID=126358 RepID=A0ABD1VT91_9LAMI
MKSHQEPRSGSSCAACKLLKRRCTPSCQFAPYFRSDEPNKFAKVHKVFGASNVSKILNEVPEEQREDAVNSLVYEADVRLKDPVYGCIGAIASLQKKMIELQDDLILARARLAYYVDHTVSFSDDGGVNMCPMVEAFNVQDCFSFDQFSQFPFP